MNNYTNTSVIVQTPNEDILFLPNALKGFINTRTSFSKKITGDDISEEKDVLIFEGLRPLQESDRICPCCGQYMHIHRKYRNKLKHLNFGSNLCEVHVDVQGLICPDCKTYIRPGLNFKAKNHNITYELNTYIEDMLRYSKYTLENMNEEPKINRFCQLCFRK